MIRPGTMRFGLLSLTAAALLAGVCGGIDVGAEAPPAAGVIRAAAPEGGNATPPVLRRPAAAATRIPGPGLPTRTAVTDADLGAGMVAPTGGPNTPAGVAVPGGNGDAAVALPVPAEAGTDIVRVMRPPAITPSGKKAQIIKFKESPLDMVLQAYSIETGRTLLLAPGLPKISVTLFSKRTDMSKEEYLLAIQTLLSMNGVGLLDVGNQFVKVVPSKDMGSIGIKIEDGPITEYHHEQGRHVRQMIPLKHIDINEAKKAV